MSAKNNEKILADQFFFLQILDGGIGGAKNQPELILFFGTDLITVMVLMKKNIPIHPDCIWLETILQLWSLFTNQLVEVHTTHC